MKPEDWKKFVSMVGEQAVVIEDEEFSLDAQFNVLLKKFVEKKQRPEKESVLRDSVWVERGVAWFTSTAFIRYLDQQRFTAFATGALKHKIKEAGGEFTVLRIGETTHRVIRMAAAKSASSENLPELEGDEI
jgi:hypothetical protein